MYNIAIVSVLGAGTWIVSQLETNLNGPLFSTSQLISLHRDPTGKEIFSDMDPFKRREKSDIKDNKNNMAIGLAELTEKVVLLNSQVARLKEILNDKNRRIAEPESVVNTTT